MKRTKKFKAAQFWVAERMGLIREQRKNKPTKKFDVSFSPDFFELPVVDKSGVSPLRDEVEVIDTIDYLNRVEPRD